MPRMSKSKKLDWSFFLNDRGRKAYNTLCRRCVHDCKQSFRAVVVICPHYQSKRAKVETTTAGINPNCLKITVQARIRMSP